MKRARTAVLSATGVLVAAGAGLATAGLGGGGGSPATGAALPPATAPIERTTLVQTQVVDGTLGYGGTRTATGGGGRGTVTWLAKEGTRVGRGRWAHKVDNRPVPLLYGKLPLYRTLSGGIEGPDVRQVERNLRALGYTGFTVDDTYGSATVAAVKRWQEDIGLKETGTITQGSVLIASGEIRVAGHKVDEGDPAKGPLFTYTGTGRKVTVDLDIEYRHLVEKGDEVSIELPDGYTLQGKITSVGKVAEEGEGDEPTTIGVRIAVRAKGSFDQAPVTVHLTADRHEGVLAVPIGALLARPGGGYAVEVVEGPATRKVPVETGVFSRGKVQISGSGLRADMKVGVPE